MNRHVDARGDPVTGVSTETAEQAYERALAALLAWRAGASDELAPALQEAPQFVMAQVLQAYLLVGSRDARRVRRARPVLEHARGLPANARERLHLAAIAAVIADDYEAAKRHLGVLLGLHPRDVLALHMAHAFDYVTGDSAGMLRRVEAVLPAWSKDVPGYHAVLAMQAFSLEECGAYQRAEQAARAALALNAIDTRAHHVMAHVFEMTDRPDAGQRWLQEHAACWDTDSAAITHCWWHLALFHLAQGDLESALSVYDQRVRAGQSGEMADLIDAAALLWRFQLRGGAAGARWAELASAWAPHIEDRFCTFSDLHAMLAFVGAGDWPRAQQLERVLAAAQSSPTRHGDTTRLLGLPAGRALIAFGRGNYALATRLFAFLSGHAHRLGGSHAQRDVLHLTLLQAVQALRRPTPRPMSRPPREAPTALNPVVAVAWRGSSLTARLAAPALAATAP